MTDPLYMLPLEGWAYKITDRRCPHYKDDRHKGDCSVCTREVLVEAVTAETAKINLQVREEKERADHNYKNCKEWEEHWKNAHAETIKVEVERDAANRLNGELKEEIRNAIPYLKAAQLNNPTEPKRDMIRRLEELTASDKRVDPPQNSFPDFLCGAFRSGGDLRCMLDKGHLHDHRYWDDKQDAQWQRSH